MVSERRRKEKFPKRNGIHSIKMKKQQDSLLDTDKKEEEALAWRRYNYRWVILACFCLLSISTHSGYFIFTSSSHVTGRYYRLNILSINALDIVYDFFVIPLAFPFSYVADKHGLRVTLIVCACLNAVGAIVRSGATERTAYQLLLAGSSVSAFSLSGILFLPPRLSGTWFSEDERGFATGLAVASDSIGMILGFLESTLMLKNSDAIYTMAKGFRNLLRTQAAHATLVFVLVLLAVRDKPPSPPSLRQAKEQNVPSIHTAKDLTTTFDLDDEKEDEQKTESNRETLNNPIVSYYPLFNGHMEDGIERTFFKDVLFLLKHRQFIIIVVLNASAHLVEVFFTTFLNEMLILKFPDKHNLISLMAICGIALGIFGNIIVGYLLAKFHSFPRFTILLTLLTTSCFVAFGLLYTYCRNFIAIFVVAVVALTSCMSYFTVCFEHAAFVTSPVPESTSAMLLVLTAGAVVSFFTVVASQLFTNLGPNVFLIVTYTTYAVMLVIIIAGQFSLAGEKVKAEERKKYKAILS